jgi:protein arginine N-methyltransferase 7
VVQAGGNSPGRLAGTALPKPVVGAKAGKKAAVMVIRQPFTKPLLAANAARRIAKQNPQRAAKWVDGALQDYPDHPALTAVRSNLLQASVPHWHIPMMNDSARNGAYAAALAQMIRPGMRVFEIGTGAGLLAMMAIRAGADHVVTCEANQLIADVARQVIRDNGLTDKVTIIPKLSSTLTADEIGGACDLLIAEIFDSSLVGECALPSIKHAKQNLLRANGLVCPARGWLKAQLVRRDVSRFNTTDPIDGFDLSAFARFEPPGVYLNSDDPKLSPIGAPVTVIEYDFAGDFDLSPCEIVLTFETSGIDFDGVAFWMGLEVAPGVIYECPPGARSASHWGTYCLLKPASMRRGREDAVTVRAAVDVDMFQAWFDIAPNIASG